MAVTALMKFTQASGATDLPGIAVIGELTGVLLDDRVTITNGDNTNVESWSIELLYAPSESGLTPGVLDAQTSPVPVAYFDPDVPGSYRCRISVSDSFGHTDVDIRNFSIPNYRGIIVPPYQMNPVPIALALKSDELNFGGQTCGWLGTRTSRMHDQFFYTYADKAFKVVDATPFTASQDEADIYLVLTSTIGGPSEVELPATARVGQVFVVADGEEDAFDSNITVNLPIGHSFPDAETSKTIWANCGSTSFMYMGSLLWKVVASTCREVTISLLDETYTTFLTGYTRASSKRVDIDRFPTNAKYTLEMLLETTNAANSAVARLWNTTMGSQVAALSSVSLTPEVKSTELTSPMDLPRWGHVYEVQLKMGAGALPDSVAVSGAQLRVIYADADR